MGVAVKILLDTFARNTPQWCWRTEWSTGYDSAFGLFMKFAYLNALTAKEIATVFVSRTCKRRTVLLRTVNIDLRDDAVFDLSAIGAAMSTSPAKLADAFLFSQFPGHSASSENLKWCEQCMAWGLHLPLTQMNAVSQCPIHNQPLIYRCRRCDETIPYKLCAAVFDNPFKCPRCSLELGPRIMVARSWVPEVRSEHIARISLMHKYVSEIDRLQAVSHTVPMVTGQCIDLRLHGNREHQSTGYITFVGQVLDEMASNHGQHCLPLIPLSKAVCGYGSAREDQLFERFGRNTTPDKFQTSEEMRVVLQVYKALKRRMRHKLGGHRHCVVTACRHIWWDMRGATTASFCPSAATYIRWRMLWEGCGTPRYLDATKRREYYGILGWLQARPAPYPDEWPIALKEWMLAHIFASVCLASYSALESEVAVAKDKSMVWEAYSSAVQAVTHWVLARGGSREGIPIIFTPFNGLLRGPSLGRVSKAHHQWHATQLSQICR